MWIRAIIFLSAVAALGAAPALDQPVDFQKDVRPILSDHCFACHGPDKGARQADLRLDTREAAFAKRGENPVIIPGDAPASRLFQRMNHEQAVARMPPPNADRHPRPEQVETIRRWIDQGAQWQTHWAYSALEPVQGASIDQFVRDRLDREGLKPSPQADRRTLLRRLSFDLTGVPPKPEHVESFVNDRSANAYEKQVDRLLASPHYGERMALEWLDLARYADTHGYHIDSKREMWPWRDWVIRAFNQNKPFDEFTVEQIAGDLLPNPTRDQLVATAFNRNHMINFEGGAIPEEYHVEYVVDRAETVSTVWLATTMGCARCHDHKYDPVTQKEFYQFYAFFNSIDEKGLDGVMGNAAPTLRLPSAAQEQRFNEVKAEIKQLKARLPGERITNAVRDWEQSSWNWRGDRATRARRGLIAHYEMEGDFSDSSGNYRYGRIARGEPLFRSMKVGRGASFDVDTHVVLEGTDSVQLSKPFTVAFWMRPSGQVEKTLLHKMDNPESRRGFEVRLGRPTPIPDAMRNDYGMMIRLSSSAESAIVVKSKEPLVSKRGEDPTYHVTISYDGSGRAAGIRLLLNGEPAETEVVSDDLRSSPDVSQPFELGAGRFGNRYTGTLDDLRIYSRVVPLEEVRFITTDEPMRAKLRAPLLGCDALPAEAHQKPEDDVYGPEPNSKAERCRARRQDLRRYYLTHVAGGNDRATYASLVSLKAEKAALKSRITDVMVMRDLKDLRETYMLGRGDYRNRAEEVSAATPAWLPAFPEGVRRDRLGLARWLVSDENPLTARVAVNRFWQMYFGRGLVATAEDFGSQGELPTHPKLLDYLAHDFVKSGWDLKRLQKKIVMSETYRQTSRLTPELIERDPENRLLARGARFRLPAEFVRDNALAIAGLLNREIGGPSVFPYQPEGIWKDIAYGGSFTAQVYRPGSGDDLYRRSLYTFWKRTAPPPSLSAFDAPDREKCIARRARTNTPLQALVLMNDPTFVEAARVFAQDVLLRSGGSVGSRLRYAYTHALSREPSDSELELFADLARTERQRFAADVTAARKLVSVGESPIADLPPADLAAWTTITSAILNLDETITKQ